MLRITSNPMIKRLRLPECAAGAAQQLICLAGGLPFPALNNSAQRIIRHWPQHSMDVIGHHHPGIQSISFIREESKRASDDVSDLRVAQPAFARAAVQKFLHLAKIVSLNVFECILQSMPGTVFGGGLLHHLQPVQSFRAFRLILYQHIFGKRIGEPESYKVTRSFALNVRQVTTRVNAGTQGICRLRLHAGHTQFKLHALRFRISLRRKHARNLRFGGDVMQAYRRAHARSAELHSAVSQNCILRPVRRFHGLTNNERSADCKSAIQQIKNLRYGTCSVAQHPDRL